MVKRSWRIGGRQLFGEVFMAKESNNLNGVFFQYIGCGNS